MTTNNRQVSCVRNGVKRSKTQCLFEAIPWVTQGGEGVWYYHRFAKVHKLVNSPMFSSFANNSDTLSVKLIKIDCILQNNSSSELRCILTYQLGVG